MTRTHEAASPVSRALLASDLDGTLIPPERGSRHDAAIAALAAPVRSGSLTLAYVTGRRLELALEGVAAFGLPVPRALACDVGTSIYWMEGGEPVLDEAYDHQIRRFDGYIAVPDVLAAVEPVEGVTPQPSDCHGAHKTSFFVDAVQRGEVLAEVSDRLAAVGRARLVHSRDATTGRGLLDVLPEAFGKASAVAALVRRLAPTEGHVAFAGDSGNDRDALLAGNASILVGNAPASLKEEIREAAAHLGLRDRLYFAGGRFSSGVIEGLAHFGLPEPGYRWVS